MKKEIGRNDPCYCQSGKKFKKCCGELLTATEKHHFSKIDESSSTPTLSRITKMVSRTLRKNGPKKWKESQET